MKTLLLKKIFNSFLLFGLLLLVAFQSNAQDLKTTHDDAPQKGHALYKKSKIYDSKTGPTGIKPKAVGDRAMDRWNYEQNLLRDPYTNKIPESIKLMEAKFADKIEKRNFESEASNKSSETSARSRFSWWRNKGPYNVGGRTRALAIDRRNENVVFAGGVSGGLWRSYNKGKSWRKVTRKRQSPSITSIVQDPRRGKSRIWYYASGERFGNSASAGGAFYTGTGIYKSTNNGYSWRKVRNSNDDDLTAITSLDIINSIAIDPKNGDLYAATFEGVFRSKKGRGPFEEVLHGARDSQTEVMITPEGKIYATVSILSGDDAGFFVSDDGDTWTSITPPDMVPAYGRTVMGADPSDENRIFFFSYNLADFSEAFLWRYQADADTQEEQWADLSDNLPTSIGGPVGNLNLQGAYNMLVKVHPTNPDLVFIGGTNLYRSTTGFTTQTGAEGWIGGYATANNISVYPNQHPDQHNLVFLKSDPNKAISGNDGGVQITEDITDTDAAVEWTSLNNGYITTQPYVVSFDPEGNSDDLLAGFQDNGTWFTNSKNGKEPWAEDFGGDGSYNAIADGGRTRYVSAQRGVLYRLNFDESGEYETFTRVQPAGASGFGFIAPFILDPINDNIMYMPAGDVIWRNNNLDEIPLFSNASTTVNWVEQKQTATLDESNITALDVSKFPVANTLYYGTSSGGVYRVENANLDDQEVVDISTGKGMPPGNVNSVYVDPSNSDRVFVVFSNYNIPSLFMSENAGKTWKNISGNLEENADGSGNGPSVRSIAINGKREGYFVGTSTGVYFSYFLRGNKTRWWREPFQIGNAVVPQVKTRADGFVAAAVHGNGVFSANFYVQKRPEPTLSVAYLLADKTVATNSDPFEVDITDLFVSSKKRKIQIELTNSNPNLVSAVLDGNTIKISIIAADTEGSAAIGLIATSGKERVSEGFTVNVVEPAVYEQTGPAVSSRPSQNFLDFGGIAQTADDFVVPEGAKWKIKSVLANGVANNAPAIDAATVVIYLDNNGAPGQEVYNSGSIVPTSDPDDYSLDLELPEEVELESGSYWVSVYANLNFGDNAQQWFWYTQANVIGNEAAYKDPADLFGTGAVDWTPASTAFGSAAEDQVFQIFGLVEEVGSDEETDISNLPDDELESQSLAELDGNVITTVWPNPSSSEFFFSIKDSQDTTISARVYNILGQLVHEKTNIDATQPFSWNASSSPAGLYLVKITGSRTNKSFSIVKK